MSTKVYTYSFEASVQLEAIESTLLLAIMGVESLHGPAQTRLDAAHFLDPQRRACVIDASTPVGADLCRLFTGYLIGEFGQDAFQVRTGKNRSAGTGKGGGGAGCAPLPSQN